MTALWWLGAFVAFGGMMNLLTVGKLKDGIFWLVVMLVGASIMYGTY